MKNYNWPTLDKILPDSRSLGAAWVGPDGRVMLDGFTDSGASPIPNEMLMDWIAEGFQYGSYPRRPHAYYDRLRDRELPERIGGQLGLGEDVRIFYSNSGSEAIEAAIKLARRATGRSIVWGIAGDFHGRTYGAMSLHYDPLTYDHPQYHFDGFGPFVEGIYAINGPDFAEDVMRGMSNDLAAIVVSPVNTNNTLEDQPDWVWDLVRYARSEGALIIFDEVQTGFGRGGGVVSITQSFDWFSAVGILPDIYVFGKGCAAGWPMSLTVARSELADQMTKGSHFNTMSGAPIGAYLCARYIDELGSGMMDEALGRAERIEARYGDKIIRRGYLMAIRVDDVRSFIVRAWQHGLILVAHRDNKPIRFSPPVAMYRHEERHFTYVLDKLLLAG